MKKTLVLGAIGAVIVLCFVWACDDASSKDAGTQSDASSDGAFDAPEPVELPDDSVPLADLSSGVLMATCDDIVSAVGFTHEELIVVTCLGQLFLSTAEDAPEPPTTKPMCESALATCVADSPVTAELAAVARSIDCKTVTASLGNYGGGASTGELRACLREANEGFEAAAKLTCADMLEDPNRLQPKLSAKCMALLSLGE